MLQDQDRDQDILLQDQARQDQDRSVLLR